MDESGVSQIVEALDLIHASTTTNSQRLEAQNFLEKVKANDESPFWGYQLALPENNRNHIVRHFGLTLLQHSLQYKYQLFDSLKAITIRNWVIQLCTSTKENDPHYLKEKVAFLWVDIAKRCWGNFLVKLDDEDSKIEYQDYLDGWSEMDNDLLKLWELNKGTRELSLIIIRTLFEDIYLLDDPIAAKRNDILTSLCSEILTPEVIINSTYEPNPHLKNVRSSPDGWFIKWYSMLNELLSSNLSSDESVNFLTKLLQTFKTCLHWCLPQLIVDGKMLEKLSSTLMLDNIKIKTLSIDCLHILFTRAYSKHEDFLAVVGQVFTSEGIATLRSIYESVHIDVEDIDENLYALLKKLVEMVVGLSEYLNITTDEMKKLPENADVLGYLHFVISTTNHPSLIISGLSLQLWVSALRIDELSSKPFFEQMYTDLLEIASNRLLDYHNLGEENVAKKFLELDFDSQPDTNVFLSTYKKHMDDIIRITVCKKPEDGLMWLNNRLEMFFSSALGQDAVNSPKLKETDEAYIYGVAQFNIIEATIRGISRWRIWYTGEDSEQRNDNLNKLVENLGEKLLALNISSPMLIRKQVQTLVQFAPLLKDVSPLMFRVLEKVLTAATFEYPSSITDDERELIRDLRTSCGTELNRLAYMMPDSLKAILNDLEAVISGILAGKKVSDHEAVAFKSFLLVVSQRSSIENKAERFAKIVDPELAAWSAAETEKGLLDLHWFMERLGIVEIAGYFQSRGITAQTDLLQAQMDDRGRDLKTKLKDHWASIFPIRATRIFIQYSIEKLGHDSPIYLNLLDLWKPRIQPILQHILQLISQIQSYHNPDNWKDLPEEVQSFVKYSCMERFWQQGVSIQSKDTFMEENVKAMHTLRDFADSVGHIIRYTREYAFLTIGSIVQLEDTFYEIPNIATMLWKAVAGDTRGVTLHSWRHMINIVLRGVIKNCPVKYVEPFMLELLPQVLTTIDDLLMAKWNKIYETGLKLDGGEDDETLSEEMMEEHMLRLLTAVVDRMLIDLVGQMGSKQLTETQVATRKTIVSNKSILAPFLQLCCHIVMFKDTRCSFNTILILRNLMRDILLKDEEVDKYLSDHLIKGLLLVLTDDYFQDSQSEAGYALTTLYITLRSRNDYPARILQQSLQVSTSIITNFETLLVNAKSLRQQKSALIELINLSKSADDNIVREQRKKMLESAARRKKKGETDVMEDPYVENGALNNLFGDE